ncbi:hypothetical protein [Helicobacter muridarum]|uniref:Uncharacterized protein n=1 Tax=Helicobacter muridarum TaxID=216 RepID=A0A377PXJ4_9HELI|nr:hypothetical protein [Helicobacter muridarum]STQ87132.1 Uncharacterised protein [Helicobacter muridarum]
MKDFIYPTIVFILFLSAMGFVMFYTYSSKGTNSYESTRKGSVTTIENLKREIMKTVN